MKPVAVKSESPEVVRSAVAAPVVPEDITSDASISAVPDEVASARENPVAVKRETESPHDAATTRAPTVKREEGTGKAISGVKEQEGISAVAPRSVVSCFQRESRKRGANGAGTMSAPSSKRLKTENAFHLGEVEYHLNKASKYAKEGNRFLMDHQLGEAMEHAKKSSTFGVTSLRVASIRGLLVKEQEFHLSEVEYHLNKASKYAKEGNRFLMDHQLGQAIEHAKKSTPSTFGVTYSRAALIRGLLVNERKFHLGEVEYHLNKASNYAKEGNRLLMDHQLGEAMEHAKKSSTFGVTSSRVASIRGLLVNEREFHLGEVEYHLNEASNYAKEGNRFLMDYQLGEASEHAGKSGSSSAAAFLSRVAAIRSMLDGTVVKIE